MGNVNNVVNLMTYVVAYNRNPEDVNKDHIGERDYTEINPVFTTEVCRALVNRKKTCHHCYQTGVQHFSKPGLLKWAEACWCVKRRLDKMEDGERNEILFGSSKEDVEDENMKND